MIKNSTQPQASRHIGSRTGRVLAASTFFTTAAIAGSSYHDHKHPALTYEISTRAVSDRLKIMAAGSIPSEPVSEFASLLADRLQPNLVPVGFLHQCQCLRSEILRGDVNPQAVPALTKLKEQEDPELKNMLAEFVRSICPSICPSDYARILLNELRPEPEMA